MIEQIIKKRKRRSDRRHIIYIVTNVVTDEKYVGIASCVDRSGKETLAARWSRHVGRAYNQNKDWALCRSIRKYGPDAFVPVIFDFVRGKSAAFAAETELRKSGDFTLNSV